MTAARRRLRQWLARVPGALLAARITLETIRVSLRYRVTGLASEIGYFALLSMPPLLLGLFGGLGYLSEWVGPGTTETVRAAIVTWASRFLTPEIIDSTIGPTLSDVTGRGRFDLISLGFLLSLWSGSRALNVILDTVSIMYGQSGVRGIVPTRALSFSLYVLAVMLGVVTLPLVFIGPTWLDRILPAQVRWLALLYWPVVVLLSVASLAGLFHIATPRRTAWVRELPGAFLALIVWIITSFVVRGLVASSLQGGNSIYGPLSAPIVILIWLYFLAIAILIGAAFNAALRQVWPLSEDIPLLERIQTWLTTRFRKSPEQIEEELAAASDPFEEFALFDADRLDHPDRPPLVPLRGGADPDFGKRSASA